MGGHFRLRVFASVIVGPLKSRFPLMGGHERAAGVQGTIEERGEGTSALGQKLERHSAIPLVGLRGEVLKGVASCKLEYQRQATVVHLENAASGEAVNTFGMVKP